MLPWISCGKANRDIGQIVTTSPRTVNMHMEQIFIKLGVENRTAAAPAVGLAPGGAGVAESLLYAI